MMLNNFNVRPFSAEDRLFLLSGGTVDIIAGIKNLTNEKIIRLDNSDTEMIREIHSKALHFLECDSKGEVFGLTMSFLETLFKCLWENAMDLESVNAAAEKLAIECAKYSQFRIGEPVPREVIQFALS